jgi:hypothetical protein
MVVGAVFAVVIFGTFLMLTPVRIAPQAEVSMVASTELEVPAPARRTLESRLDSRYYRALVVPGRLADAVTTETQPWVDLAERGAPGAQAALERQLDRFRAAAPLTEQARTQTGFLPSFERLRLALPAAEVVEMEGALGQYLADPRYEQVLANDLLQFTPAVLVRAAEELSGLDLGSTSGLERARRLHSLLVQGTGCTEITLFEAEGMSRAGVVAANRRLGTLWTWYLNEIAHDQRTWKAFRSLRSRR